MNASEIETWTRSSSHAVTEKLPKRDGSGLGGIDDFTGALPKSLSIEGIFWLVLAGKARLCGYQFQSIPILLRPFTGNALTSRAGRNVAVAIWRESISDAYKFAFHATGGTVALLRCSVPSNPKRTVSLRVDFHNRMELVMPSFPRIALPMCRFRQTNLRGASCRIWGCPHGFGYASFGSRTDHQLLPEGAHGHRAPLQSRETQQKQTNLGEESQNLASHGQFGATTCHTRTLRHEGFKQFLLKKKTSRLANGRSR